MIKMVCLFGLLGTLFSVSLTSSVSAKDWKRVVQAEEILGKIEKGEPVMYDSVFIKGELDLEKINLATAEIRDETLKVIDSRIEITSSCIERYVNFSCALLKDQLNFERTEFEGDVLFRGSFFSGENWKYSKEYKDYFGEETRSKGTHGDLGVARCNDDLEVSERYGIDGGVVILAVIDNGPADKCGLKEKDFLVEFNGERIKSCRHFMYLEAATTPGEIVTIRVMREGQEFEVLAEMGSIVQMGGLVVSDKPFTCFSFFRAHFKNAVSFTKSRFEKGIDFSKAHFDTTADFNSTIYKGEAYFEAHFDGEALFSAVRFGENADFSLAKFGKGAMFFYAHFKGEADFAWAEIKKGIGFNGVTFEDTVDFSWIDCEKMLVDWSQIKGKLRYDELAYAFLRKNFENLGAFEDADRAYYEYRNRKRRLMKWYNPVRYAEYLLLNLSCGYGTRPFQVVCFSVGLILAFSFCFCKTGALKEKSRETQISNPNPKTLNNESGQGTKDFGNALYFSVNTFTTVGYGDWVPTEEYLIELNGIKLFKFRHIAMVEGFFGWVMLSLFLITLARTWIR